MFNFFKRGNKDSEKPSQGATQVAEEDVPWGVPVKRKMSKKEEAAEAAEQEMVERKNRERRDMYRLPGNEHIFNDLQGRRLAIRVEDNTGPKAVAGHPDFFIGVFWGARELAHVKADFDNGAIRVQEYRTEGGYEGWGLPAELLREMEKLARSKGIRQLYAVAPHDQPDWNANLFSQQGYQIRDEALVKAL